MERDPGRSNPGALYVCDYEHDDRDGSLFCNQGNTGRTCTYFAKVGRAWV